jgi:hypothetical protein
MKTYHKIETVFKRNPETKHKTLIYGDCSLPEFEFLANNEWVFTEKVDGTNIRVIFDGKKISFAGKTDRAQIPKELNGRLCNLFYHQLYLFKKLFPGGVCLYGEGYGPKIQRVGGNYSQYHDFVLFDIKIGEYGYNVIALKI